MQTDETNTSPPPKEPLKPSLLNSGPNGHLSRRSKRMSIMSPREPLYKSPSIASTDCDSSKASCVSFAYLEITEHSLRLCDNPGCRDGPPIGLGTEVEGPKRMSIDEYEQLRVPRRARDDLRLTRIDREGMLQNVGYSRQEMEDITERIRKDKVKSAKKWSIKHMVSTFGRSVLHKSSKSKHSSGGSVMFNYSGTPDDQVEPKKSRRFSDTALNRPEYSRKTSVKRAKSVRRASAFIPSKSYH